MLERITFIMIIIFFIMFFIMSCMNVSAMNDEEPRRSSDSLRTVFVTWGFSVILFIVMCVIKRICHQ